MPRLSAVALVATLTMTACSQQAAPLQIDPGTDVRLETTDGVTIEGRLLTVTRDDIVLESPRGERMEVRRNRILRVRAESAHETHDRRASTPPAPMPSPGSDAQRPSPPRVRQLNSATTPQVERQPDFREVTIPAGTVLPVELLTAVASDTSSIEDPVRATLRKGVTVDGAEVLPAGTIVSGNVTAVERAARVKGRAHVALRFTALDPPGSPGRVGIRTDTVSSLAPATKKADAAKIGGGAAGGAIVGGILGGGDGAAKGAAIGGAAGTGVVLSTRGKEVRLGEGTALSVRLAAPVVVRVPAG